MAENKLLKIRFFSKVEVLLGLLAAASILLVLAPQTWINRKIDFDPLVFPPLLVNDSFSRGNSQVSWLDEEEQAWKCKLGNIAPAYCSFILDLGGKDDKGIDLSQFEKMTIWLDYEGTANSLRLYLRNASEPYYDGSSLTTKYNQISVPVEALSGGLTLDMEVFRVANWWLSDRDVPLKYSHPEFNNIIYLEIQTGDGAIPGDHKYRLRKIVWTGPLVSNETIFRSLILAWSAIIFSLLFVRLIQLKVKLVRDKREQAELVEVNKLLDVQNKELADLARTDQLTGLMNRVGIRDALYENLKNWQDKRTPFSLIMIDIDHFKQVNDQYGHEVGDEVLKSIAVILTENTRRTDCPARWGGEEFVLLCQDCDLYRAQKVAELLRGKIEVANVHPAVVKVTASFGVASMTKPDANDLFKRADLALYDAKMQGRNRVCVNSEMDDQ